MIAHRYECQQCGLIQTFKGLRAHRCPEDGSIMVKLLDLSAKLQPIELMQNTQDSVPRADIGKRKHRPIRPRSPIQQLSASLDLVMLATGRSEKYLAGTIWNKDVEVRDEFGRTKKQPSLPKQYYKAAIQQKEPRSVSHRINRREEPFVGEIGNKSFNPASVVEKVESPVKHQKDAVHQYTNEKTGEKGQPFQYTRRTIDRPSSLPVSKGKEGLRNIEPEDLLNTEGYRTLKKKQLSTELNPKMRTGWSEADLIAHDVPEKQREILRRGVDQASSRGEVSAIQRATVNVRKNMVSGDVKPELTNVRTKIARDSDINRRIVHAIRKESGNAGFFRKRDEKIIGVLGAGSEVSARKQQSDLLAAARGNFDTHLTGEIDRRKSQAGKIYDMVRQKAHEKLVEKEHGPDWRTKLSGRAQAAALKNHEASAQTYAEMIHKPERHDELADLIGTKPEGLEKVRQNINSLKNPDYATHRKVENRIIRSGRIFNGTPAFTPPEPIAAVKKGFPTLKKIGIAGAALGAGALGYHLLKKRKQEEPQKQLMSSRARLIQFAKKFPVKLPKKADSALSDLAHKLINKSEGVAAKNEAKFIGGKIPGPEAPASQWAQVEAAQDISPEATELVEGARKRVRKALAKPGGLKAMQPHDVVGDKMATELSPMAVGQIGNEKKKLASVSEPRFRRGFLAAKAQGRTEPNPVERGDVDALRAMLAKPASEPVVRKPITARGKSPNAAYFPAGTEMLQDVHVVPQPLPVKMIPPPENIAKGIMKTERVKTARGLRADRNTKRGFIQQHGVDPDSVITGLRSELINTREASEAAKIEARKAAAHGIHVTREKASAEVSKIKKSSEAAKIEAISKATSGHAEQMKKSRSNMWRNTAIGTGAGLIGGAALAGNASRQTYEPKRKQLMSAKGRVIQLSDPWFIQKKSTTGHDIATGALEGAALGPFTEPLFSRLQGEKAMPILRGGWKGFGRRAAIGGLLGAGSTALIGAGVNLIPIKRKQEMSAKSSPIQLSSIPSRSVVTQDRYRKGLYDKDEERASKNYERAALAGGTLSALLRGKKTRLGTFMAGAGAGIGTEAATRALTSSSKDQFGDRSHLGKKIDKLPWQVPTLVAGGIIGKRAYRAGALKMGRKGKLIQFISEDDFDAGVKAQKDDERTWRRAKTQVSKTATGIKRGTRLTQDIIRGIKGQKNLDSRGRERKREWDKPWVRNAITGTIAAGTLYGFHKTIKSTGPGSQLGRAKEMWHQGVFHDAAREKIPGFKKAHDWVRGFKGNATAEAGAAIESKGVLGRMLDKVQKVSGRTPALPIPATKEAAKEVTEDLSGLKKIQQGKLFEHSAKGPVIQLAAEDWEERKHGDLLHVAKIRRRNRREKNTLERKDWQDSVVTPAKIGVGVLTGALGARLLGPRIIAASGAGKAARRVAATRDLTDDLKKVVNQHSLEPLIELNAMLDDALDPDKKKDSRGLHIAEAALTAGSGVYALMRHRKPLPKGASGELKSIREAAEKHGFTRVEHQDRIAGRAPKEGPSILQRLKTAVLRPADQHEHLIEGAMYSQGKRTKAAVFDPEESGRLRSPAAIGENRKLTRSIERSKLDEYKVATGMGIPMPHTAPLKDAASLKRGYIAKAATGSQSRIVVTRKMIAQHDPAHPDLLQYKKFRRITHKAIKDPDVLAHTLNRHPGYGRWMTEQAITKPHKFVQQKGLQIASEHRVHTLGGESLGINSGRHAAMDFLPNRNRKAEKAVNQLLAKAKPKLKGTMMAVDVARDTKNKWRIIETNPGTTSGYLTSKNPLAALNSHQLYRRVTGRHSQAASLAGGLAAAGLAGNLEARATRDNQRKPRTIAAA